MIIAIDGPAGAGKSSVAKQLAKILKVSYLDTGAMYRALTLKALREKINLEDEDALLKLAHKTHIDLEAKNDGLKIFLDGKDVSEEIRSLEVTNNTFYIARAGKVREVMVNWQRDIGGKKSLVAEGRDIGTVVFPNATMKFYLDATVEERCRRRVEELRAKGKIVDASKLMIEIKERDEKDFTRKVGPLKKAGDAVFIESSKMSVDQTVQELLKYIKN